MFITSTLIGFTVMERYPAMKVLARHPTHSEDSAVRGSRVCLSAERVPALFRSQYFRLSTPRRESNPFTRFHQKFLGLGFKIPGWAGQISRFAKRGNLHTKSLI
jgi:hypothetical protein